MRLRNVLLAVMALGVLRLLQPGDAAASDICSEKCSSTTLCTDFCQEWEWSSYTTCGEAGYPCCNTAWQVTSATAIGLHMSGWFMWWEGFVTYEVTDTEVGCGTGMQITRCQDVSVGICNQGWPTSEQDCCVMFDYQRGCWGQQGC